MQKKLVWESEIQAIMYLFRGMSLGHEISMVSIIVGFCLTLTRVFVVLALGIMTYARDPNSDQTALVGVT